MKNVLKLIALLALASIGQAANFPNIPISYLPFTISAPGTYVLNTDLTLANANSFAINMNQPVGDVVLDLKGQTLHIKTSYGILVHLSGGAAGGITIQNGTLEGFAYGIEATTTTPNKLTHLTVQNITFKNNLDPTYTSSEDIHLSHTNGVIVKGCNFVGVGRLGVMDKNSATGNIFTNLSLDGQLSVNIMQDGATPLTVSWTSHN